VSDIRRGDERSKKMPERVCTPGDPQGNSDEQKEKKDVPDDRGHL